MSISNLVEGAVNLAENVTGVDIDRDGDIGVCCLSPAMLPLASPPVVFPELHYPEAPGCCRAGRRGDDGEELESNAVLFVSEDNPGATDLARELQQAAPTKLRLVYSSDALKPGYAEQLQECTHFIVLLNRQTFVKDTDPDRPGERLAKQLREAFRIKNHLNPANYRFKASSK